MPGHFLQKCFLFICLFYICPKIKYHTLASFLNHSYKPGANVKYPDDLSARRWLRVMRDNADLPSGLDDAEPGFDLTKDEIVKFKIWPRGIIPYYIDDFSFDKVLRDKIRQYLDLTNRVTGLKFMELPRPPNDEKMRWVFFLNRQGLLKCADHSIADYTNEGVQKVILGYDCLVTGGELAEVILALVGVPPQHNAPDRNEYIEISKENILPEKMFLFEALKNNQWLFFDVPYDFLSASHYSFHKYTKNGFATIKLNKPVHGVFTGQGKGFSYNDIWKIRMLYNYNSRMNVNSIKASDCIKLFELGTNFSNYKPLLEDIIQPRQKPAKYLGLPANDKEDMNKIEPKPKFPNKTKADLDYTSGTDEVKNDASMEDQNKVREEKESSSQRTELKKNSHVINDNSQETNNEGPNKKNRIIQLKKKITKPSDPFRDMSDYESWETTKTLQRIFTKVKG